MPEGRPLAAALLLPGRQSGWHRCYLATLTETPVGLPNRDK